SGAARHMDVDFRRWPGFLVPFGGRGYQFTVGIAAGDVGHQRRRQRFLFVDLAAALGDRAVVREVAQYPFQFDAVGILETELAGDLLRADLARMRANECDNGFAVRKMPVARFAHISRSCQHSSSRALSLPWPVILPLPPFRVPCSPRPTSASLLLSLRQISSPAL